MIKTFLLDTAERAIKTACQTALGAIGSTAMFGEVNWYIVGSTTLLSVVVSVLTSVASYNAGTTGTASLLTDITTK